MVTTVAGGFSDWNDWIVSGYTDGLGAQANFYSPTSILLDGNGVAYVGENNNRCVRKVTLLPGGGYTVYPPLPAGLSLNASTGAITGAPASTFPATNYTITASNVSGGSPSTISLSAIWTPYVGTMYPTSAMAGDVVLFFGVNMLSTTAVSFGGVPAASFAIINDTTLTAVVAPGSGNGAQLTAAAGTTQVPGFTYISPPSVTYPSGTYSYTVGVPIPPLTGTLSGVPVTYQSAHLEVTTLAGNGTASFVNGTGTAAGFSSPNGMGIDMAGNLYVADCGNHSIRKITPTGVVSTLAGTGTPGSANGMGTSASFAYPYSIVVDQNGNVFVGEIWNHQIRKIDPQGFVTTYAGNGVQGFADGPAASAQFDAPVGLALDNSGNLYVVDGGNYRVRKVSTSGMVTTVAGSGFMGFAIGPALTAGFSDPVGIAVDGLGNIYVADADEYRIKKISPAGIITNFAGDGQIGDFGDGVGTSASFFGPWGLFADPNNNLFVTDRWNNRIRRINPLGVVTTPAGNGDQNFVDGPAANASFNSPAGVVMDANGNLFVADAGNNSIRKISVVQSGVFAISPNLPAGLIFDTTNGTITGVPTVVTPLTNYTITATTTFGSGTFVLAIETVIAPVIIANSSTAAGPGDTVTLTGIYFTGTTGVSFGGVAADTFWVVNDSTIIAVVGAGSSGSVTVTTPSGSVSMPGFSFHSGPTITGINPANNFCAGQQISISFTATGFNAANEFTAQLSDATGSFASPVVLGTLNNNNGGTIAATVPAGTVSGTGYRIRVVATIPGVTGGDNGTGLTINALPDASQTAISVSGGTSICAGASTTLTVSGGSGLNYQWLESGTVITGATSSSYTASTAGSYTVQVSSAANCVAPSAPTVITVNPTPVVTLNIPAAASFCAGDSLLLTTTNAALAYQWLDNGNAISGATNDHYTVLTAGDYSVSITDANGCSGTSPMTAINVTALPTASVTPASAASFCSGQSVVLQAATGTGWIYQWMENGNFITGANNSSYTANAGGSYAVLVADANGCTALSSTTTVSVNPLPTVIITDNGNGALSSVGTLTSYQWYENGTAVPGATGASFTATQPGYYYVIATDANGCSAQSNVVTPTLSVQETATFATISVSPNPSTDGAVLLITTPVKTAYQVRVMDLSGRILITQSIPSGAPFSFGTQLVPGVYTIEAINGTNRMVQKWVKQ